MYLNHIENHIEDQGKINIQKDCALMNETLNLTDIYFHAFNLSFNLDSNYRSSAISRGLYKRKKRTLFFSSPQTLREIYRILWHELLVTIICCECHVYRIRVQLCDTH